MSKVFLLKDIAKFKEASEKMLKGFYSAGASVAVKLHFGEPGNKLAFTPEDIKPLIESLKSFNLKPFLTDTTVIYDSPRDSVEGYTRVAKDKGFGDLAPIVISEEFIETKVKDFTAKISKGLVSADGVLVISHVKGRCCSGFGGAIKNLGMGGVMKETKQIEHTLGKPKFLWDCKGCGTCAALCPFGAIKMKNGKAEINYEACMGCSVCQTNCPYYCLAPEKASFDDLLAQGASAVINNFPPQAFYINFIARIAKNCDCWAGSGGTVAKDVGILFSDNPVAIDKASLDLVNEAEGKEVFKLVHHKDPMLHINFAAKYTGKTAEYELVCL